MPIRNDVGTPLAVSIEDGALVIRVGMDTLKCATEDSPDSRLYHYDGDGFRHPRVVDAPQFVRDVVLELAREGEDGTTVVHTLMDNAVLAAAENGSAGILWWDDPDWTAPKEAD